MTLFSSSGIAYHKTGNGKRTIVFIHGFIFDSSLWQRQIDELKENHTIVSVDLRGFGESQDCDGMITLESYVDDLLDLIKELEIEQPILAGLSMGGYIALRAAEKNPGNVAGLILFDTRATADSDEAKLKRAAGIRIIKLGGIKVYATALMESIFSNSFKENEPEEYKGFIERGVAVKTEGAIGALLAMMGRTNTTSFLESTELPVMAVCGESDSLTPPQEMEQMMKNVKNGEFHIVKDAGHGTPFENPAVSNELIRLFMKRFD